MIQELMVYFMLVIIAFFVIVFPIILIIWLWKIRRLKKNIPEDVRINSFFSKELKGGNIDYAEKENGRSSRGGADDRYRNEISNSRDKDSIIRRDGIPIQSAYNFESDERESKKDWPDFS